MKSHKISFLSCSLPNEGLLVGDAFLFLLPLPKEVIISALQISSSCRSIRHRNRGAACRRAICRNVPARSILEGHAREAGAIPERIVTDAHDRVTNRHSHEAVARVERRVTDARDGVGDRHAREATAFVERTITNARDGFADCHAREAVAIAERIVTDARHGVGDFKLRVSLTYGISNQRGLIFVIKITVKRAEIGVACIHFYAPEARATVERLAIDAGDGVGDCHARETGAIVERIATDAGDGVGDGDARDIITVTESAFVDCILFAVITIGENQLCIASTVTEQIIRSFIGVKEIAVLIDELAFAIMHL